MIWHPIEALWTLKVLSGLLISWYYHATVGDRLTYFTLRQCSWLVLYPFRMLKAIAFKTSRPQLNFVLAIVRPFAWESCRRNVASQTIWFYWVKMKKNGNWTKVRLWVIELMSSLVFCSFLLHLGGVLGDGNTSNEWLSVQTVQVQGHLWNWNPAIYNHTKYLSSTTR